VNDRSRGRFATPADCPLHAANVWELSIVQGPFSVAPCQTPTLRSQLIHRCTPQHPTRSAAPTPTLRPPPADTRAPSAAAAPAARASPLTRSTTLSRFLRHNHLTGLARSLLLVKVRAEAHTNEVERILAMAADARASCLVLVCLYLGVLPSGELLEVDRGLQRGLLRGAALHQCGARGPLVAPRGERGEGEPVSTSASRGGEEQVVRFLGDAKSSLGDAESSLGDTLRARWVTLRARWVTLRARWVTLRARWVTLRARWVTLRARWVTLRARWGTLRAWCLTLRARWVTLRAWCMTLRARWVTLIAQAVRFTAYFMLGAGQGSDAATDVHEAHGDSLRARLVWDTAGGCYRVCNPNRAVPATVALLGDGVDEDDRRRAVALLSIHSRSLLRVFHWYALLAPGKNRVANEDLLEAAPRLLPQVRTRMRERHRMGRGTRRTTGGRTHLYCSSRGEVSGLAGVTTRPAGYPHPWGATSCRNTAPRTVWCIDVAYASLTRSLATGQAAGAGEGRQDGRESGARA
jgi:hypothetical protein